MNRTCVLHILRRLSDPIWTKRPSPSALSSNTIKTNGGLFSFHLILLPRGFKGVHNCSFSRQDFTRRLRKPFSSIYLNIMASAGIYLRNLEWQKRHSGAQIKPESGKSSSEMELVAWFQSFEITGAEIAFHPWVGRMKQILYDYVGPQYQFNILTKMTGTHAHTHARMHTLSRLTRSLPLHCVTLLYCSPITWHVR